jgi:hypothetical protein
MTIESLLQSNLRREFEAAARSSKQKPAEVLAQLTAEFIESQKDAKLFDAIEREARKSGYSEDDAVDLVRAYRQQVGEK